MALEDDVEERDMVVPFDLYLKISKMGTMREDNNSSPG
jgi:hypothetical protein